MGDVEGADFVIFYQGWAEGAHYEVLERTPCAPIGDTVTCAITVKDDLIAAVGIDFNVADTFHIQVDDERDPVEISTTSNDPEEMWEAFDWVFANKPELFEAECTGALATFYRRAGVSGGARSRAW